MEFLGYAGTKLNVTDSNNHYLQNMLKLQAKRSVIDYHHLLQTQLFKIQVGIFNRKHELAINFPKSFPIKRWLFG